MTGSSTSARGARGLWRAAGACVAAGAFLVVPTLNGPGGTEQSSPSPSPAVSVPPSLPPPPRTGPTPTGGPGPTRSSSPSSPRPSAGTVDRPDLHDEPVPSSVPPLPADAVHGHTDAQADPGDEQQWRPVLIGFARDFTHGGDGTAAWARRLSRWTTPQLAAAYEDVDPREIPTGALVDLQPTDVGAFTLAFTARYDTGLVLHGQAAYGPTSWRVTVVEPVRPTGAG